MFTKVDSTPCQNNCLSIIPYDIFMVRKKAKKKKSSQLEKTEKHEANYQNRKKNVEISMIS